MINKIDEITNMIVLSDTRLLHGLVVKSYVRNLGINSIFIADNEVFEDSVLQQIFEMVKPVKTWLQFWTLETAAKEWKKISEETKECRGLVLVREPEAAYQLFESGLVFSKLIINNSKSKAGKKRIRNLYLDQTDMEHMEELRTHGVNISVYENIPWPQITAEYYNAEEP